MTRLTRRRFVQLIGTAVATIHLPKPVIAKGLPRLMGDGIHNDGPALTALFSRQPIEISPLVTMGNAGWEGDTLTLPQGRFRIEDPIHLADLDSVNFAGQKDGDRFLTHLVGTQDAIFFNIERVDRVEIQSICFSHEGAYPLDAHADVIQTWPRFEFKVRPSPSALTTIIDEIRSIKA